MRYLLCTILFFTCTAFSSSVKVDVVRQSGNVYDFKLQFFADAPPLSVFSLITDYDQLVQLNPLIKSSRQLPSEFPRTQRVEVVTRGCMLFFCKTIIRVEDVKVDKDLTINTVFVPELSDFTSGESRWTFTPMGEQTLVDYHVSMVPDFWLPPFIGPRSLKKQLRQQLHQTAERINYLLAQHGSH